MLLRPFRGTLENFRKDFMEIKNLTGTFLTSENSKGPLMDSIGLLRTLENLLGPFFDIRKFKGTLDNEKGLFRSLENFTGLFQTLENFMATYFENLFYRNP